MNGGCACARCVGVWLRLPDSGMCCWVGLIRHIANLARFDGNSALNDACDCDEDGGARDRFLSRKLLIFCDISATLACVADTKSAVAMPEVVLAAVLSRNSTSIYFPVAQRGISRAPVSLF